MGGKVKGKNLPNSNSSSSVGSSSKKKKNMVNRKKNTVKNTLDNPFTLDWPSLNFKDYTDIKSLLQNSLSAISEDYVSYHNEKVTKRREFYAAKLSKKDSEKVCKLKTKKIKSTSTKITTEKIISNGLAIGHESLVFGYNAVMRGLEKGSVVSVLVYSKAKPDLIVKMFIPICSVKTIPIIPIDDLADIVKDARIGIRSCLALGLKKSVALEENIFHQLYLKTCEALGFDALLSDVPVEISQMGEESSKVPPKHTEDRPNEKPTRLSAEQIKSFHLYRKSSEERIFKPNELEGNDATPSSNIPTSNSEFIRLTNDISELKKDDKDKKKSKKQWQKPKTKMPNLDASKLPSTSMFMIDAAGDSPDIDAIIKVGQAETSDVILPLVNPNNTSDGADHIAKEPHTTDTSTFDEEDNKKFLNKSLGKSETNSSASMQDSTEILNSPLPSSGKIDERPSIDSTIANSASIRPLMSTNQKKRKFEEFCYVPTKVKRVKSNANRKSAKK